MIQSNNMSTRHSQKRILVVEDEEAIRSMLTYALESQGFLVVSVNDAQKALRYIGDELPDLILLDWMLPGISGVTFVQRLKRDKLTANIPVILLTARAEESSKVKGFEAGVDDYVTKPFSPRELVARVRAVLRRGVITSPEEIISLGKIEINTINQIVKVDNVILNLGPREYRLLVFFVSHRNRVYSRPELLSHVWGNSNYVDERTVDVLIRRLRKQLQPFRLHRHIQTVHGTGYRFSEKANE